MDGAEMILLYDYYGDLLTKRQRECFELRYNQDLSYGEIGEELGISRQGVFDNLSRAEALLKNMEEKTGLVKRDMKCRRIVERITGYADQLSVHPDQHVSQLAREILSQVHALEE